METSFMQPKVLSYIEQIDRMVEIDTDSNKTHQFLLEPLYNLIEKRVGASNTSSKII